MKENVQVINPFLKFSIQSKMFLLVQMGIELAQSHANIHGLSFFQGNSSVLKTRLCRMQSESTLLMCTKLEVFTIFQIFIANNLLTKTQSRDS